MIFRAYIKICRYGYFWDHFFCEIAVGVGCCIKVLGINDLVLKEQVTICVTFFFYVCTMKRLWQSRTVEVGHFLWWFPLPTKGMYIYSKSLNRTFKNSTLATHDTIDVQNPEQHQSCYPYLVIKWLFSFWLWEVLFIC